MSIPLDDGEFGFAQVLEDPLYAFFNLKSQEPPGIDRIVTCEVLFTLAVQRYAITKGVWEVIGHAEISSLIDERPKFFIKDIGSRELFISYTGEERIPATVAEVEGLERLAVWEQSTSPRD